MQYPEWKQWKHAKIKWKRVLSKSLIGAQHIAFTQMYEQPPLHASTNIKTFKLANQIHWTFSSQWKNSLLITDHLAAFELKHLYSASPFNLCIVAGVNGEYPFKENSQCQCLFVRLFVYSLSVSNVPFINSIFSFFLVDHCFEKCCFYLKKCYLHYANR